MPRCIICDHCSDLEDHEARAYRWDEEDHGYICEKCDNLVALDLDDFFIDDEEGTTGLGGDEVLEDGDLEDASG